MSELTTLLDELRADIDRLTPTSAVDEAPYQVMMGLFDLGLLLEGDPSLRPAVQPFLDQTAPALRAAFVALEAFGADLSRRSEVGWSDDLGLFEELCTRRSALAFLGELYAGTALAPALERLKQDWFDSILRDVGHHGHLPADAIAAETPARHWWWWLPGEPPA